MAKKKKCVKQAESDVNASIMMQRLKYTKMQLQNSHNCSIAIRLIRKMCEKRDLRYAIMHKLEKGR